MMTASATHTDDRFQPSRLRRRRSSRWPILFIILCLSVVPLSGCAWSMYQGNTQRTGRTTADTSSNSGTQAWVSTVGDMGGNPVIGTTNIYIGASLDSSDYNLYALNSDGTVAWKFPTGGVIHASPAIGVDGTIFAVSTDGNLYAINANGGLKWKFALPCSIPDDTGQLASAPAIGPVPNGGGLLDYDIYLGDTCGDILVLTASGAVQWQFAFPGGGWISPIAIAADGTVEAVYMNENNTYDTGMFAVTSAGSLKWTYDIGPAEYEGGPAIASDGTAYMYATPLTCATFCYGSNAYLYAVNSNGALKWQVLANPKVTPIFGMALGADGTVYLGTWGGGVRAFDSAGNFKWAFTGDAEPPIFSGPVVSGDGTIFAGSSDSHLYALNPNGSVKWSAPVACQAIDESPIIGRDGTVYISVDLSPLVCGGGQLYAFH